MYVSVCVCACASVHVSWCACFAASVYPAMFLAGWGRIVNTASGHGLVASVNKSAYIASKHGIVGLTKVSNSPTDHAALSVLTSHQVGKRPSLRQCTHLLQPLVTLLVGLHLLCVTVHVQGRDVRASLHSLQAVAVETAQYGITCNAVCPAYVLTDSKCVHMCLCVCAYACMCVCVCVRVCVYPCVHVHSPAHSFKSLLLMHSHPPPTLYPLTLSCSGDPTDSSTC